MWSKLTIRKLQLSIFTVLALTLAVVAGSGIVGISRTNDDLNAVYHHRLIPVGQLAQANRLIQNSVQQMAIAVVAHGGTVATGRYITRIATDMGEADRLIAAFLASDLTEAERVLVAEWTARRHAFVAAGLKPAIAALEAGNFAEAEDTVLGVAAPLNLKMQDAFDALVAKQLDVAETISRDAQWRYDAVRVVVAGIALFAGALAVLAGWLMVRTVVTPLDRLGHTVDALGRGELDAVVPFTRRQDEIGPLARALEAWRLRLIQTHEAERKEREELLRREARQRRIEDATRRFDSGVTRRLSAVGQTIDGLHRAADVLSGNAQDTKIQSGTVSESSEDVTVNVETVAAATNELAQSIQEISRQVSVTSEIVRTSTTDAANGNRRIAGLTQAAGQISEVVRVITDIANRTNMLALNASIEAARAGDSGKGFAVVANEVRSLAVQTAQATDDISRLVTSIQHETQGAVEVIGTITATMERINEFSAAIAGALEEQGAATAEIVRSVGEAAGGARQAAISIASVATGAQQTGQLANDVYAAANGLKTESSGLREAIEHFLSEVHAA